MVPELHASRAGNGPRGPAAAPQGISPSWWSQPTILVCIALHSRWCFILNPKLNVARPAKVSRAALEREPPRRDLERVAEVRTPARPRARIQETPGGHETPATAHSIGTWRNWPLHTAWRVFGPHGCAVYDREKRHVICARCAIPPAGRAMCGC